MTARVPRATVICASSFLLVVAGVACQNPSRNEEDRISRLESSVATVSSIATRVNELEGKDQGLDGQVASLNQSLAAAQASLNELKGQVASAQGADAALKKKVDGVASQVSQAAAAAGRIGSIEQKLTLLETRYNDHLRKYHGGG